MGIPYIFYGENHRCTLCNKLYECINLEKNFCENGFHSMTGAFLCRHCPETLYS